MKSKLRALIIGDIGHDVGYHVGDDAMTLGLLKAAERAGLTLDARLVASDPVVASAPTR